MASRNSLVHAVKFGFRVCMLQIICAISIDLSANLFNWIHLLSAHQGGNMVD